MQRSNALTKVIESCLDDERTLFQQSKLVWGVKSLALVRLADERRRFSEELERLSCQPIARGHLGSWHAIAREAVSKLRTVVRGKRSGAAIETCRRSQDHADRVYEEALELDWPADLKAVLVAQHERIHAAQHELAMMSE